MSPSIVSGAWWQSQRDRRLARFGIDDRIVNVPEVPFLGDVLDFVVADGGLQKGVPIDQPLATIDLFLGKQVKEGGPHRGGALFIEREASAVPIAAASHPFELTEDPLLVLVLPLPDPLDQAFATDVMSRKILLFLEPTFHHRLRRDPGVVGSRHPKGFKPHHSMHSDDDVLQRVVQAVAEMQCTGDVGRRDHDGEGFAIRVDLGVAALGLLPSL